MNTAVKIAAAAVGTGIVMYLVYKIAKNMQASNALYALYEQGGVPVPVETVSKPVGIINYNDKNSNVEVKPKMGTVIDTKPRLGAFSDTATKPAMKDTSLENTGKLSMYADNNIKPHMG